MPVTAPEVAVVIEVTEVHASNRHVPIDIDGAPAINPPSGVVVSVKNLIPLILSRIKV